MFLVKTNDLDESWIQASSVDQIADMMAASIHYDCPRPMRVWALHDGQPCELEMATVRERVIHDERDGYVTDEYFTLSLARNGKSYGQATYRVDMLT